MRSGRVLPVAPDRDELERSSTRSSLPRAARDAPSDPASHVLRLQQLAGNRAVRQAIVPSSVQRQPAADGATAGNDRETRDPELEAVLAQVEALMPSAPRVPAFEAITATTAGEFSEGELEEDIERLWTRERVDFTEAARRTADRSDARRRPRATRSASLPVEGGYALRWSVNLFASDYPRTRSDLPDVARIARRGSPFRRSLDAEFGRTIPVTNPTARQIESAIFDATLAMWTALEPGTNGEIVVTYSGHGGNGIITGVDWVDVGPGKLRDAARLAADHNVHLVFVLDTCRAGTLASYAGGEALRSVGARIDRLPADQQAGARARVEYTRRLGNALFTVGQHVIEAGDAARDANRRRTDAHRLAAFEAFHRVSVSNHAVGALLRGPGVPAGMPSLAGLMTAQEALGWSLLSALTAERSSMTAALRDAALVLDLGQDVANEVTTQLDAATRAAPRREGATEVPREGR